MRRRAASLPYWKRARQSPDSSGAAKAIAMLVSHSLRQRQPCPDRCLPWLVDLLICWYVLVTVQGGEHCVTLVRPQQPTGMCRLIISVHVRHELGGNALWMLSQQHILVERVNNNTNKMSDVYFKEGECVDRQSYPPPHHLAQRMTCALRRFPDIRVCANVRHTRI